MKFDKTILIIGDTGMLGSELTNFLKLKQVKVFGCSRNSPSNSLDILDFNKTINYLDNVNPDILINCAAEINLDLCESNLNYALKINSLVVQNMALWCKKKKKKLVQISTDQFFKKKKNKETDFIYFYNNYGLSKYLGECFAKEAPKSLILRTSIIGPGTKKSSFVDWVIESIKNKKNMTLFDDYYNSSIDIYSFCEFLLLLLKKNAEGIFNISSSQIFSKKEIIEEFEKQLNLKIKNKLIKSAGTLLTKRCLNCGLDNSKVERLLNVKMPNMKSIVKNIIKNYKKTNQFINN